MTYEQKTVALLCLGVLIIGWTLGKSSAERNEAKAPENAPGAVTGRLFLADRVRTAGFAEARMVRSKFATVDATRVRGAFAGLRAGVPASCKKWAVVTTISPPSRAIARMSRLPAASGWCTVVVGDRHLPARPEEYHATLSIEERTRTRLLLFAEQSALAEAVPFVARLPWDHFGRKNVGYLFAIAAGAEQIWDFDDDNEVRSEDGLDVEARFRGRLRTAPDFPHRVLNPYPLLEPSAPPPPVWPRGFPLLHIRSPQTWNVTTRPCANPNVVVWQSTANHDPDVDAIHRLTRERHFDFSDGADPFVIPGGVFAPYNAQAQLTMRDAFWALYLPVSVNGRVSDILRAYAAERQFWDLNMSVAFTPPLVVQSRNAHDLLMDFQGEMDLYLKTEALLARLAQWEPRATDLAGRVEELWVDMYERDVIGMRDVDLVQQWLLTLDALGYPLSDFAPSPMNWYRLPV
jgi:hypothetical protein